MDLWEVWNRWVLALRPACSRRVTFEWMRIALMGLCVRDDLAGVSSIVRALALQPKKYLRLLALFHSEALRLDRLTALWLQLCQSAFTPFEVGGRVVCLADGLKVPKEGLKMPPSRSSISSPPTTPSPPSSTDTPSRPSPCSCAPSGDSSPPSP